jgi:DNA (cytosine-5)-methyltransferase 1
MRHRVLDLFSGIGGFSLGLTRAGMRTTAFCEIEKYPRSILRKHWPDVPIFEDVRELHAWSIDENAAICYNESCALKNNKKLTLKNSPDTNGRRWHEELSSSALIAVKRCPSLLVSHHVNIAPLNADTPTCEENSPPTQGEGNGCKEKGIQTGRMERPQQEEKATDNGKETKQNGGEEFLQETITLANRALSSLQSGASCERIILKNGLISPNSDLSCRMELLCAEDVTTTCTCKRANERISVVTAGFPCQPASVAGQRRGTKDDRWLWPEVIRIVREFNPEWCIFENVPGLLTLERGVVFDQVLADLEAEGYAAWPFIIPACAVNAPHRRDRVWIVAHHAGRADRGHNPRTVQRQKPEPGKGTGVDDVSNTCGTRREEQHSTAKPGDKGHATRRSDAEVSAYDSSTGSLPGPQAGIHSQEKSGRPRHVEPERHCPPPANAEGEQAGGIFKPWFSTDLESGGDWRGEAGEWITLPGVRARNDGLPARVARLKALGNAVVPQIPEMIGQMILATTRATRRNQ